MQRIKGARAGKLRVMYIGTSIFLLALGAILKFAVTFTIAGISLPAVGVILMIVGGLALIASLLHPLMDRRGDARGRPEATRGAGSAVDSSRRA